MGITVGLLERWAPATIGHSDVRYAIGLGLVWSLLCARLVYRRGIERRAALVFFVGPVMAALLVLH